MSNRLIDNRNVRLADCINAVIPHASHARMATGYFFVSGIQPIAASLQTLQRVRLLIGTTTNRQTLEQLALGFRRRELVEEKLREQRFVGAEHAARQTAHAIEREIAELQPGEAEAFAIRTLAELIEDGTLDVRVFTRGTLHAKAYVFDYKTPQPNSRGIGIIGSSNLTEPGLTSNTELNVQVDDDADIITGEGLHRDLCAWFDALWDDARPFSVELMRELRESWAMSIARPYDVYLKMLFEMVRSQLEGDSSRLLLPDEIPLAAYQKVAVQQAVRMIDQYGGAFVADVVGVGKSFVGAAVARYFYEAERRRPLIICPHALVKMWQKYSARWHLNAEIVSTSQLREVGGEDGTPARSVLDEDQAQDCRFVLIDESHNFRYADSQRYRVLTDYLVEGSDRKILLLTATPYNKSSWDVFNQVRLFHHEETTRMPVEPRNLRKYFSRVEDGERRLSDLLVHILVRRTRLQLLRWYGYDADTDQPVDPHHFGPYRDGDRRAYLRFVNVAGDAERKFFPTRILEPIDYCIDDVYGEQYGESLYEQMVRLLHRRKGSPANPEEAEDCLATDDRALTYARYGLFNYVLPDHSKDARYRKLVRAGRNLRGLIRTNLFKRLESSVAAFRESVERQITIHSNFLEAIDRGRIAAGEKAADLLEKEHDETEDAMKAFVTALDEADVGRGFAYDIAAFDVDKLRADVHHDLETFRYIKQLVSISRIPAEEDAKLQRFLTQLPALRQRGKLIVFTEYEDTARYIWKNLPEQLTTDAAIVTGESKDVYTYVNRFAPVANERELAPGEKELNLLIATDVLSEGLNLQDGNQVLNYDLHWNPVRLIQRFGRVDRVGSEHDKVYAYNFLPEKAAERQLELRTKLRARIREFNEILGMDSQVLDDKDKVNPEAVYAIYEERGGRHLGRFETAEADIFGVSLAEAEEFFRELRDRDPDEYERIRTLRDGLRTARTTPAGKLLVLCRAGDFIRLYVRDLQGHHEDIDTMDALALLKCDPSENPGSLPGNLNALLTEVKLRLIEDVDELWRQRKTRSPLTVGQRYVLDELERLRSARPALEDAAAYSRLVEATAQTRQRRFQRGCDRLRKNKVTGEALLRRVRQLYYDCALHLEKTVEQEVEIENRIPRILAVAVV